MKIILILQANSCGNMLYKANCKLNIGLRVIDKRQDGYHNLETIFYPVYGLFDELEVIPYGDDISFSQDGIMVDCLSDDNLVVRCYRLMRAHYPLVGGVRVCLHKHIPFGAGLGGGSSDAATMAIALNDIFHLNLSQQTLAQLVATLGADCAFFIYNKPCLGEGVGDILTPIPFSLKGYRLLMLKPDVSVSTREAYSGVNLCHHSYREQMLTLNADHLDEMVNDFEQTVFQVHPLLAEVKQWLLRQGASYAAMSGSGSTVFGLWKPDSECGTLTGLGTEDAEFASMIIFNDTLA